MNKKTLSILILIFSILIFMPRTKAYDDYENSYTNYKVVVEDDANLLTNSEINKLKDEMTKLTEYGNIVFKSINYNNTSTENYARNYYHENFGASSGTLFLIDMHNRIIYIFSDGENYKTITDNKADIITDNIYKLATNGDYYKCASKAFLQIDALLRGKKIAEPMKYISNGIISFIIAFLINFIIVIITSRIRKASNDEILSNCNIKFDAKNITARKTGTRREYSPRDTDSGGGSFGGGSSGGGGGSSGGGGGHSF